MIVLVGHLTENKYGVGADHILFGWVFFGVLIYVMFAIGARWREDDVGEAEASGIPRPLEMNKDDAKRSPSYAASGIATALACAVPFIANSSHSAAATAATLPAFEPPAWSRQDAPAGGWKPQISGARTQEFTRMTHPTEGIVTLYRGRFAGQRGVHRMIRHGNFFLSELAVGEASVKQRELVAPLPLIGTVIEYSHREGGGARVIRGTYVIDERTYASPYFGKLALAKSQLTGRGDRTMMVVWSAAAQDEDAARARLVAFEKAAGALLFAQQSPSSQQ
jgi:hypothetical protein